MLYVIVFVLLLAADQAVKLWVVNHLALYESRPLLPGFVELNYVQNTGGGWSVLSNHTWLLTAATAFIMALVLVLMVRKVVTHPLGLWACTLILAGGAGNLIDRVRLGYVVDMFHFEFLPSFPVFNVADMCIVCGMLLGVVYYLFLYDKVEGKGAPHGDHPSENQ